MTFYVFLQVYLISKLIGLLIVQQMKIIHLVMYEVLKLLKFLGHLHCLKCFMRIFKDKILLSFLLLVREILNTNKIKTTYNQEMRISNIKV